MDILNSILSQLSDIKPGFNLLDLIIVVVVLFYAYEGYLLGFFLASLDLVGFVVAFIIALKFYGFVANFLITALFVPAGIANALGFFITAFISEVIIQIIFRKFVRHIPAFISPLHVVSRIFRNIDHKLGIIPGIISAFIILSFFLSIIVALPSSPLVKNLVTGSGIGSKMLANTALFEKNLNYIFGGALNETLNFLTVKPEGNETVSLRFQVANGTPDAQAEMKMFKMVNAERARAGLSLLVFANDLRDVGRAHADDMLKRGYFSHYTPEGLSPFDRMQNHNISYISAGENLAFAPSTELAMTGLMNSAGHRENILSPGFGKIGIGVIDAGVYGKMYTQEFTN